MRRDGFGAHPEFGVLLAELDGGPVGYALYHPSWSTEVGERGFYIYDLYVRAGARGHGVGRALMAALAARAKAEGRTFLWWSSKAWNREAQAFYRGTSARSRRTSRPMRCSAMPSRRWRRLPAGRARPTAARYAAASRLAGARGAAAGSRQLDRFRRGAGPAEQEALRLLAALLTEPGQLLGGLDALRAGGDAEAAAELQDGADDRRRGGVAARLEHVGLVDLHPIERELPQRAQAGAAGTEIAQRDAHAQPLQPLQGGKALRPIMQQQTLGDLELEAVGRQTGGGERVGDPLRKLLMAQARPPTG